MTIPRTFALGLSLLLLAVSVAGGQQPLRWKLKKGQLLRLSVEQTAVSETTIRQSVLKITVHMGFDMDWRVREVDKGVARIEQTFSRVHMKMESPKVPPIALDSNAKETLSEPARKMANSLVPLLNLTFHVAINDRGAIQDVQLPSDSKDALKDLPPQLKDIFSRDGLKRTLQRCASELPEKAVGKDAKWSSESKSRTRLGQMITKTHYSFADEVSREGKVVSQIDVTGEFQLIPAGNSKAKTKRPPAMKVKRQELTGTIFFDNKAGLLSESQTTQTLVTETRKKDLVLNTKSKTTMRMSLRVLKSP